MMYQPLVSIVVPVYNVENYIERCIKSLIEQTYQNIEIIFVDDRGEDNSLEIIKSFLTKDSRIHLVSHTQNRGVMLARRTGYMSAKGEYITFCDSDDALPQDAISNLIEACEEGKYDIVSGRIQYLPVEGESRIFNSKNTLNYGTTPEGIYKALLKGELCHNLCSKLFRSDLLKNNSFLTYENCTNAEDAMLFYQVVEKCKSINTTEKIVYNYYQNTESSSQKRLSEKGLKSILLMQTIRKSLIPKYPRIAIFFANYITSTLVGLYRQKYDKDNVLTDMIYQMELTDFVSTKYMLKTYGLFPTLKYIFLKYCY